MKNAYFSPLSFTTKLPSNMQKGYAVTYSKLKLLIWAMIIVPLIPMGLLVSILLSVKVVNGVVLFLFIIATMAGSVFLLRWIIKNHLGVTALALAGDKGITFNFEKTNFLYPETPVFMSYDSIKNISDNYDVRQKKQFLIITPKKGAAIQLLGADEDPAPLQELANIIESKRKIYNETLGLPPIEKLGDKSFYETGFAKVLTWVMIVLSIPIAVFMFIDPKTVPWYKALWWFVICFIWLRNVAVAKKARKEKQDNNL